VYCVFSTTHKHQPFPPFEKVEPKQLLEKVVQNFNLSSIKNTLTNKHNILLWLFCAT
jgi:hypothetical protein